MCRSRRCNESLLLPYLLSQVLPPGFLDDLLNYAAGYDSGLELFRDLFEPVLQHLISVMRLCSLQSDDYKEPLTLLSELSGVKVASSRVICVLVSCYVSCTNARNT
jgi:hypothetical protein